MKKSTTYTNAAALAAVAAILRDTCEDAELVAKIEHMAAVANKPKATTGYVSAASKASAELAQAVTNYILAKNRPVTSREIGENVSGFVGSNGSTSYQRVTAALRKAIANGDIKKVESVKVGSQKWAAYAPADYVEVVTETEE